MFDEMLCRNYNSVSIIIFGGNSFDRSKKVEKDRINSTNAQAKKKEE